MPTKKTIKGYKAFNPGLICHGHKFEVGKEYIHEGGIEMCKSGFHFCENPLDVLEYYDLTECEFGEVEATGRTITEKDGKKSCTDRITVKAKLDLSAFVRASVDFLWEKCSKKKMFKDNNNQAASGDYAQLAASGYYARLAASGYCARLAASGSYARLAASGYYAQLAASGYYAQLAASGYYAQLAASGDYAQLAASGHYARLAASGYYARLAASGSYARLEVANDSIAAGIGYDNKAKGKKGSWLVLAEWVDGKPKKVVAVQIDGKKVKEDTFYRLINGELTSV
jgi:hypothetical protein